MNNTQLFIVLKEKLKNIFLFAMFCTLSVFSLNMLAETGAIPSKGMTQDQVKANFGEPLSIKPAVGKPPISRWDYQDYSVYFEETYVIHSFYHNKPRLAQPNPKASAAKVETIPVPSAPTNPSASMEPPASIAPSTSMKPAPLETETASEEAPAIEAEESIAKEEVPVKVEEAIVEEIPEAAVEEIKEVLDEPVNQSIEEEIEQKVEEKIDETKKIEEVKVEEIKVEEAKIEEAVTEEVEKDLNFEEPEKPADYDKGSAKKNSQGNTRGGGRGGSRSSRGSKIENAVTKETTKDLNFEEPEKPADLDKWGY